MLDFQGQLPVIAPEIALNETLNTAPPLQAVANGEDSPPRPETALPPTVAPQGLNGEGNAHHRHAEAGRKGAHRVQQLIREGKLYEQEHGLKSGRQRLRQLIELGKLYEQEHGSRPELQNKRPERLSRMSREELLTTFLQCLQRLAKPSFRKELLRLAEALQKDEQADAA
jgi:hypothetical protein